jgi:hypothetical protein
MSIMIFNMIATAGAFATVLAFILSYCQHKDNLNRNAPRFAVKQIDIKDHGGDKGRVYVTLSNTGKRASHFSSAYNHLLNTSLSQGKSFPVFTTAEIGPGEDLTLDFSDVKTLLMDPQTYYCTKIWYRDDRENQIRIKELYYRFEVSDNNRVTVATIPDHVRKEFGALVDQYEQSALFSSTNPELQMR